MRTWLKLVLGFIAGVAVGAPLLSYYENFLLEYAIAVFVYLLFGALACIVVFLTGFSVLNRYAKRRLGVQDYSAATIARRMNQLLWEALALDRTQARRTSEQLISEVVSYYSITTFYRWALGSLLAVVTAIGGTLGTIVLVKQNERIAEQTEVAKRQAAIAVQQTITMKGDELNRIATKINEVRAMLRSEQYPALSALSGPFGASRCWDDNATKTKDVGKAGEIVDPALRVEIEVLAGLVAGGVEGASSEEPHDKNYRANLVRLLSRSGLPFSIFGNISFKGIEVTSGNFNAVNLDNANFYQATIGWNVHFLGSCANNLILSEASTSHTDFSKSKFYDGGFEKADLRSAKFNDTLLQGNTSFYPFDEDQSSPRSLNQWLDNLRKAAIAFFQSLFQASKQTDTVDSYYVEPAGNDPLAYSVATFAGANLRSAEFIKAQIGSVSFIGADLREASFNGTLFLSQNSFGASNLSGADLRVNPDSGPALAKTNFHGANLDKAILDGVDFGDNDTLTEQQLSTACICSDVPPRWKANEIKLPKCANDACKTAQQSLDRGK